jgi:hypothetical protein
MSAVAWWGYGIAFAVLLLILGGMFMLVKVISDDSGKYEEMKAMMDPVFHPPAFLRPGTDAGETPPAHGEAAAARSSEEAFEDQCPACGERVTHEHADCPSCGLRLLG